LPGKAPAVKRKKLAQHFEKKKGEVNTRKGVLPVRKSRWKQKTKKEKEAQEKKDCDKDQRKALGEKRTR